MNVWRSWRTKVLRLLECFKEKSKIQRICCAKRKLHCYEHIVAEFLDNLGIRDCKFDESVDFVGKLDAIVKKLQENLESAR